MVKCIICEKDVACGSKMDKQKKYCSHSCRMKAANQRYGYQGLGLPTGTAGAVAELLVASDLLKKGWEVYRAISQSSWCDLLAMKRDDKSSAIFIEVRTGYRNNNTGSIAFPKQKHEKNKAFAVVIHKKQQTEIIYIPPLP